MIWPVTGPRGRYIHKRIAEEQAKLERLELRERGYGLSMVRNPLTPALSPNKRGEGAHRACRIVREPLANPFDCIHETALADWFR
jgi:hypothetical protein